MISQAGAKREGVRGVIKSGGSPFTAGGSAALEVRFPPAHLPCTKPQLQSNRPGCRSRMDEMTVRRGCPAAGSPWPVLHSLLSALADHWLGGGTRERVCVAIGWLSYYGERGKRGRMSGEGGSGRWWRSVEMESGVKCDARSDGQRIC